MGKIIYAPPFINDSWNPISGKCFHECSYCAYKDFSVGELQLEEMPFTKDLGSNKFIFIGNHNDMFAQNVPDEWIGAVLEYCKEFPNNLYLFKSKNPARMFNFVNLFPSKYFFASTIESNRIYEGITLAPSVEQRTLFMAQCTLMSKAITIEPILDFDLEIFTNSIRNIKPRWVAIGADRTGNNLIEPSKEKIISLIEELQKFTRVMPMNNLERILQQN